jgi:iron complex outermembrane receptor protein
MSLTILDTKSRTALLFGVSMVALAAASPAAAQEAVDATGSRLEGELEQVDTEQATEGPAATAPAQTQTQETIVVTGSRIRRSEATSESPLLIIDPVLAQRQGRLDTAEIIQNSPIASGSTQITSTLSTNTIANGGQGTATISLRGLGSNRTLVLLNSRRAGPAGTRGAVSAFDLNVLPSSIVQSVEVLKDGASSVYGSDAIAGVVNLITKKSTDGIELTGYVSAPQETGGETYNVSAAWGKDFGRGHILLAGDYYRRNELKRSDRDFLGCPSVNVFKQGTRQRADLIDPRTGEYACNAGTQWGHVWTYGASNLPDPSVTLLQYSYGNDNLGAYLQRPGPAVNPFDVIAPEGWYPVYWECPEVGATQECLTQMRNSYALGNAYHPFEAKSTVSPETDRYTAFVDAAFDVTDKIEVYAEGLFNRRRNYVDSYTQIYNFGYTDLFAQDDPENPFPGFSGVGYAYISPTGIIDQADQEITVDYYRGVAGVRGQLGANWQWDVFGQYSRSDGQYRLQQVRRDAISQQTSRGFGGACAGQTTRFTMLPCVQIPWTDPRVMAGDLTREEIDYLTDWEEGRTKYTQKYVEASLSGEPFQLPAGALGVAVGGVIRRDQISDRPGYLTYFKNPFYDPNAAPGCKGGNRTCDEYFDNVFANGFSSGFTRGHTVTKEAFGEVRVPIFKDQWFAKEFTLAGAARVTNVNAVRAPDGESSKTTGNWTYKGLANWQVNPWLRLRATHGTSFRAPALFEQFLAGQTSGARQIDIDPCVRWAEALADGTITQRTADNCAADGIPATHNGGGIQATVVTSGGLGLLESETSRSTTASVILTPRFSFLPDTNIALTIDYFRIKVKGEIARLTAADIVTGCYASDNFPESPLCGLFDRGLEGNAFNIAEVRAQYINIDQQENRGVDVTLRATHDFGRMGRLSFLGQATRQLKDTQLRLDEYDNFNGDVGEPKFSADLNTTWTIGDTSLFWGLNVIGKSSSERDFIELNGDLCNLTVTGEQLYGPYCYRPKTPLMFYHNASVSQRFGERFDITVGISNLLNTAPPLASGLGSRVIGSAPLDGTQYDWIGRRAFVQARARF